MLTLAGSTSETPLHTLLKKVTKVLAKPETFPVRLNLAIKAISEDLGAETATLYLLTPDRYLETYATYDATHHKYEQVRFRVGEGVVGFIAATQTSLLCDNITHHPNFLFRPGVAEHINLALLGVPLISPRGVVGVLTLLNPPSKPFETWREKALTEIGNFLGNLPELKRFPALNPLEGKVEGMQTLQGIPFNAGLAIGTAFIHHPYSWKENSFCQNTLDESKRLKVAIRDMNQSIDQLVQSTPPEEKSTHEVLDSYKMIAADRGWVKKIQAYIQKGFSAEAAVQNVRRQTRERYAQIGDSLLKGRLSDLEDLATRLLKHLSGIDTAPEDLPESTILVANNLGPAELLDYDRRFIKGLVLEEGVHTAHVAIIARALDIPVVGRVPLLLTHVSKGDRLIVDGKQGTVLVNPKSDALQEARGKVVHMKKWQVLSKELKDKPCQTLDGHPITLTLNAGLPVDLQHLGEFDFKGVGLYRTEIPFMMRSSFPDVQVQAEIYRDVYDQMKGLPITFRTLDIGGDKVVPYMWRVQDENPVLGWRAIRVSLDKPSIMRQQVRALLQASQGNTLNILFPMISDITEYWQARKLVEQEWTRTKDGGAPLPSSISYGVMIEVPSLVSQLEPLLKENIDFVSLGTNDLFQFFYACDRTNPTVSTRYDTLSSTFLSYLRDIHRTCKASNVPLSVCGDMATSPLGALALLSIGCHSISIPGPMAGDLKKMILSLPLEKAEKFMEKALKTYSPSLRESLQDFAQKHQIYV